MVVNVADSEYHSAHTHRYKNSEEDKKKIIIKTIRL